MSEEEGGVGGYENPVIRGCYPDPSVCCVDGVYYLAASSFEWFPGLPLFRSEDLVNWEPIGHALDREEQVDLRGIEDGGGLFAPTLRHWRGCFYLVCTVYGGRGNFILWTEDPAGRWEGPVWFDEEWFDPSLYFDDDGTVYYTRRHKNTVVQARFDLEAKRLAEPLREIAQPFSTEDVEGPHLFRRGEYYYLLCAEGGTSYGHCATIGRSRSPWGPFESCPTNPILTHRHRPVHGLRCCGHGDLVQTPEGRWWIFFLGTRHRAGWGHNFQVCGREVMLAPVTWRDGWPEVSGGSGQVERRMTGAPAGQRPRRNAADPDDLSDGGIGPAWLGVRRAPSQFVTRCPDGGVILSALQEPLESLSGTALLARRQTELEFSADADLEVDLRREGDESGVVVYRACEHHARLTLALAEEGRRVVRLVRRHRDLEVVAAEFPAPEGPLQFRVDGDYSAYRFFWRSGSDDWKLAGEMPLPFMATDWTTGWTGVVLGLCALSPSDARFRVHCRSFRYYPCLRAAAQEQLSAQAHSETRAPRAVEVEK